MTMISDLISNSSESILLSLSPKQQERKAVVDDYRVRAASVITDEALWSRLQEELKSSHVTTSSGANVVIQKYVMEQMKKKEESTTGDEGDDVHAQHHFLSNAQRRLSRTAYAILEKAYLTTTGHLEQEEQEERDRTPLRVVQSSDELEYDETNDGES
mmetsp:Transcript_16733/g.38466  ORF Transcript_16733/g.38466 Transcript_16733/m.38466 type:complete len:158 (-) Transcript_16733:349-822(-)|eukprot:CAMPEP_0116826066 /NCGR_PEP_ID=MMETSP0418-20121206/2323_1 /TAXON_ID=1158023 /ORGANISM="Astrosyne radiata, Strain 13vi08-1A" /LENGTH=157 /DNA_ID=CAMNT_0004454661 /DNA_START=111 /DNA_END=584 /DNA_ORIENTATION=-